MTILYISSEYPPDTGWGGIGTYTAHTAQGMAARGHRVHVICRSVSGRDETFAQNGVTVHRTVQGPYPLPAGKAWYPLRMACYRLIPQCLVRLAWAKSAAARAAALAYAGTSFDAVECPECGAEGFFLQSLRHKLVVRLHTPWHMIARFDDLPGPWSDPAFEERLERRTTRQAADVTSPTRALAEKLSRRWNLPHVTVFPNPIPVTAYEPTTGGGWIYTGRIERRKGIEVLLRAYAAVRRDDRLPRLTLLGRAYGRMRDGIGYGDYIRALIADLDLGGQVTWISGVAQSEVASFLARSSVAFFPSLWENFPYSCLEAMACGCAVAAARCGGFPEMIDDGASGLLFEPGDVQSLASVMRRFSREAGLAPCLGNAARAQVAARFDSGTVCERAEAFYASRAREVAHA